MRSFGFQLSQMWDEQVQKDDTPIPGDNHIPGPRS